MDECKPLPVSASRRKASTSGTTDGSVDAATRLGREDRRLVDAPRRSVVGARAARAPSDCIGRQDVRRCDSVAASEEVGQASGRGHDATWHALPRCAPAAPPCSENLRNRSGASRCRHSASAHARVNHTRIAQSHLQLHCDSRARGAHTL